MKKLEWYFENINPDWDNEARKMNYIVIAISVGLSYYFYNYISFSYVHEIRNYFNKGNDIEIFL